MPFALAGLEIRLIAQGASRWTFSFVVQENNAAEALKRLLENREAALLTAI
jgi:hypothetical protein